MRCAAAKAAEDEEGLSAGASPAGEAAGEAGVTPADTTTPAVAASGKKPGSASLTESRTLDRVGSTLAKGFSLFVVVLNSLKQFYCRTLHN